MHRYAITLAALAAAFMLRADDKGTLTELAGLKSTTPANWKAQKPDRIRVYRFSIPKDDKEKHDTEVTVMRVPLENSGAGAVQATLEHWKDMIKPGGAAKEEEAYKTSESTQGDRKVTYFEAIGTYVIKSRGSQIEARPDHRFIGVVFQSASDTYLI